MEFYPNRYGSEYYKYRKKDPVFVKSEYGHERYAIHSQKGEIYPDKGDPFAKTRDGLPYYAKDRKGNEKYPLQRKKSLVIQIQNEFVLAKYADGKERYPVDFRGNEYYLVKNEEPYVLKDAQGEIYSAKTCSGKVLIPWNYFEQYKYLLSEHYKRTCDAAGNCVYQSTVPVEEILKKLFPCLCLCLAEIPTMAFILAATLMSIPGL
ncbi:MAG: hypothetical protein E7Y34_01960 [Mycoplasma sp.]|nr:hypothetical protein [Mycoplasma sp.]